MHYSDTEYTGEVCTANKIFENIEHDFWYGFRSQIGWSQERPEITMVNANTTLLSGSSDSIRFMPKELGTSNFFIEIRNSSVYSRQELHDYLIGFSKLTIPHDIREMILNNRVCVTINAFYTW